MSSLGREMVELSYLYSYFLLIKVMIIKQVAHYFLEQLTIHSFHPFSMVAKSFIFHFSLLSVVSSNLNAKLQRLTLLSSMYSSQFILAYSQ